MTSLIKETNISLLACDVKKYRAVIGRKYKVPVFLGTLRKYASRRCPRTQQANLPAYLHT